MSQAGLETERSLLCTLMISPADCWGVDLSPEQFASEQHGELYRAIQELTNESKPADPVSVMDHLQQRGQKSLSLLALTVGVEGIPTKRPIDYAKRVSADWRLRRAQAIARALATARDEEAIDTAVEALLALHTADARNEFSLRDALKLTYARLEDVYSNGGTTDAVPTGLSALDGLLGGLHRGDLVIVGARPGLGKTALMVNFARHAAANGFPVGVISGEQPVEQISARLLSLASGVEARFFRSGIERDSDWPRVTAGLAASSDLPMWILDRSSPSISEIVRIARRWKHAHGIRALYVDYLQRIDVKAERRHEAVGMAAKALKNLARDLDIPVIALAQVSREVERREPPEPRMGDLADSSEIEKEADQVMLIYRADNYDRVKDARPGIAKIILDKNRHGPTGYVEVAWNAAIIRFEDIQ